jgi:hypothetical protein
LSGFTPIQFEEHVIRNDHEIAVIWHVVRSESHTPQYANNDLGTLIFGQRVELFEQSLCRLSHMTRVAPLRNLVKAWPATCLSPS